jgi:hypothetical protein
MELGNIVFGNSRGEYPIERDEGFEKELYRLFEAVSPERDNSWREYGVRFENDIFSVFPYYWGDCTCGYDLKEGEFSDTVWHTEACYQVEYAKVNHYNLWNNHDEWIERYVKPLYQKFGFETESENWWHGCSVRCTCDYEQKWEVFLSANSHDENCPIVKPNFLFKPTGFSIKWYKYPLRDSYMSQKITLDEFRKIVSKCVESCKAFQQSVQPTGGSLRDLQAFSTPEQNPAPKHYRVPHTSR